VTPTNSEAAEGPQRATLQFFLTVTGEATNAALNENPRELIAYMKPVVERTVKNVIQKIANKITQHFTLQELLPED
jgi:hypothetical protein